MAEPLFASERIAAEWENPALSPLLKQIVQAAVAYGQAVFDWTPLVTCIYRTPDENDAIYGGHGDHLMGVHVVWRGVDVRTRGAPIDAPRLTCAWASAKWIYDPKRPAMQVAFLEGTVKDASSGPHAHFQVSPATVAAPTPVV